MGKIKMKTTILKGLALCSVMALSACATVVRGTTDEVKITSVPEGLEAETTLGTQCTTPCAFEVKRKNEFTVTVTGPEGDKRTQRVETKIKGAGVAGLAGNVLIGGIIGAGVDAATGAGLTHVPNPVHFDFTKPENSASSQPESKTKTPPAENKETAPPTS
jgi:hypothetical protein